MELIHHQLQGWLCAETELISSPGFHCASDFQTLRILPSLLILAVSDCREMAQKWKRFQERENFIGLKASLSMKFMSGIYIENKHDLEP